MGLAGAPDPETPSPQRRLQGVEVLVQLPVGDGEREAVHLVALDRREALDELLAEPLAHELVALERVEGLVERERHRLELAGLVDAVGRRARVEVTEILRERNRVCLRAECRNQAGEPVIEGEAWVMPSKQHIEYAEPARQGSGWTTMACAPAALAVQAMSFWTTAGLTFAQRMAELWQPGPARS